jgi:hypothetical protein
MGSARVLSAGGQPVFQNPRGGVQMPGFPHTHMLPYFRLAKNIYGVQCETDGGSALGHPTDVLRVGESEMDINRGSSKSSIH